MKNVLISSESIGEQVRMILRQRILDGTYRSGEKLVEKDISIELGVSRTPIRDAMIRLETEGLIKNITHKGPIVSVISPQEFFEIFDLRFALEPMAVELATRNASREVIDKLADLAEKMELALEQGDDTAVSGYNIAFHCAVYEAANRKRLLEMLSSLLDSIQLFAQEGYKAFGRSAQAMKEHRLLVDAIRRQDVEAAISVAKKHIEGAKTAYLKLYPTEGQE
ncbi:GntR family transcriptional regulator [Alicyclobacillus sp. SO9]|uniref:GntR family transcriptional regulator n=1 Tax=Alicyclobacillus sp. SO9 TaxID=2665646 RepID=UPI0018E6FE1B|nr:GntR family transcriptional regulator [Alicyclobacillus sp. SO9]QQE78650.1 GntR family transcriptional regulator [Alicyclobacillus sp. SO9]